MDNKGMMVDVGTYWIEPVGGYKFVWSIIKKEPNGSWVGKVYSNHPNAGYKKYHYRVAGEYEFDEWEKLSKQEYRREIIKIALG